MYKVYITNLIPEEGIKLLERKGFRVDKNTSGKSLSREKLSEIISEYDAIITLISDKIDAEMLREASSNLKIISNFGVGYDNIDVLFAKHKGIVVTNTPGVAGSAVAEHTFALILGLSRKILEADRFIKTGKYKGWDPDLFVSHQIFGETMGIIGLGRIGTCVGQVAFGGFKMKILYNDIIRSEDFEILTGAQMVSLEKLLKDSDIVTLHTPLTAATRHLIGEKELEMMKKEAILINTARGEIVDQEALIEALLKNKILGAGLDVFENEPDIPHTLRVLGNVILTPHVASATYETRAAMGKIAAQNIIDVFEGRNPQGVIRVA